MNKNEYSKYIGAYDELIDARNELFEKKFERMKQEMDMIKQREEWSQQVKEDQKYFGKFLAGCVVIYLLVTFAMIYFNAYPMIFL